MSYIDFLIEGAKDKQNQIVIDRLKKAREDEQNQIVIDRLKKAREDEQKQISRDEREKFYKKSKEEVSGAIKRGVDGLTTTKGKAVVGIAGLAALWLLYRRYLKQRDEAKTASEKATAQKKADIVKSKIRKAKK